MMKGRCWMMKGRCWIMSELPHPPPHLLSHPLGGVPSLTLVITFFFRTAPKEDQSGKERRAKKRQEKKQNKKVGIFSPIL